LQSLLSTGAPLYEVAVFRQSRLVLVELAAQPDAAFGTRYMVEKLADADETQKAGFQKWLGWEF
jgi:hypothetical protein